VHNPPNHGFARFAYHLSEIDSMRRFWIVLSFAVLFSTAAQAQSTCRDGTASKSSGRGTCSHHGGVARPAEPTLPTTRGNSGDINLPRTEASPTRESVSGSSQVSEPSGGTKVWVNTKSGVYHCPATRWYGATKSGEYMTERQARAAGDRPAYGRSCS
jgi:hypothetical protein